jgi:F0F1-type ATP synthase assembly protein I
MNPDNGQPAKRRKVYTYNMALAVVASLVGGLTLVIVLVALFGGLWLDSHMGTRPKFTIGLLLLSIPITLLVMLWVTRAATSRLQSAKDEKGKDQ